MRHPTRSRGVIAGHAAAIVTGVLLGAAPALGHPGHEGGAGAFTTGLAHPITGLDHLLVAILAGLVLAQLSWRRGLVGAAAMIAAMLGTTGATLVVGLASYGELPATLTLVALALVAGLDGASRRPRLAWGLGVAAAAAHGAVHGTAAAASGQAALFLAGLGGTTAVLVAVGILAGTLAQRPGLVWLPRVAGGVGIVAAVGAGAGFL